MPYFNPTESGKAFPETDVRHWMLDDERAIYTAAWNPDIVASSEVSVKLREFRGKRNPKKLTPEQEEREAKAGDILSDYARACDPGVMRHLLKRLAQERRIAAGEVNP